MGGKSLYCGGWYPRLQEADLAQWLQPVRGYLTVPPTFGSNLPNRAAPAAPASIYEAAEFEIGVRPADDSVFDPVASPNEPPDQLSLNAALKARLLDALGTLPQGRSIRRSPCRPNPSSRACSRPTSTAA